MKINRGSFLEVLSVLKPGLAGRREIIEQSNCIVFKDGRIWTYNDEMAVSVEFAMEEAESFAVPSTALMSILMKLPEGEMDVTFQKSRLGFKVGKNRKVGINIDEEVVLPVQEMGTPDEWKALPKDFARAVSLTGFSAATRALGGKASLMNICVQGDVCVSCDIYRSTRYVMDSPFLEEEPLLVPGKAANIIAGHEPVEYGLTSGWIHLKNESGVILSVRVSSEQYPFEAVNELFQEEGESLDLPKELKNAVECAMVFSDQEYKKRVITLTVSDGVMKVEGENGEGFFKQRLEVESPNLGFQIDPELMLDCISLGSRLTVGESQVCLHADNFQYVASLLEEEE